MPVPEYRPGGLPVAGGAGAGRYLLARASSLMDPTALYYALSTVVSADGVHGFERFIVQI